MDYRRIEWVFLIVFIFIDIYLVFNIWQSPVQLSGKSTSNNVSNIRTEMQADHISVPAMNDKAETGYYLAANNTNYFSNIKDLKNSDSHYDTNTKIFNVSLVKPVTINSKSAVKDIENFKNNPHYVPYGKEFKYSEALSAKNRYVFVQNTSFGQIYDNRAQLVINTKGNQIIGYKETYLGKVNSVRELQATISSWKALQTLYTYRELPKGSSIKWVKLGYSTLTNIRQSTILLPTWVIGIANKDENTINVKRINAFSGQIITNRNLTSTDNNMMN